MKHGDIAFNIPYPQRYQETWGCTSHVSGVEDDQLQTWDTSAVAWHFDSQYADIFWYILGYWDTQSGILKFGVIETLSEFFWSHSVILAWSAYDAQTRPRHSEQEHAFFIIFPTYFFNPCGPCVFEIIGNCDNFRRWAHHQWSCERHVSCWHFLGSPLIMAVLGGGQG